MATKVETLQERKNELATKIKKFRDDNLQESGEWRNSENEANWAELNGDYDKCKEELDNELRVAEINGRVSAIESEAGEVRGRMPGFDDARGGDGATEARADDADVAFRGWAKYQSGEDVSPEERAACERQKRNPRAKDFSVRLNYDPIYTPRWEGRAQATTTTGAGGATFGSTFVPSLERELLAFAGPRAVSTVVNSGSGDPLTYPTVDDTGNTGDLLAENTQVSEQDVTFSEVTLNSYKISSDLVRVSAELLQDTELNLPQILGSLLGERLGRKAAAWYTTGTGSSQPNGIVTAASAGKTTASATAIAADELFDLQHSLDAAYRSQGAGWMMHDNILLAVRKLKDTSNNYLWQEGLTLGEPDRLLGSPISINQNMASSIATTNVTMLYGLFSKFLIRDVGPVRIFRLTERYRDYDQDGFVAFMRTDSDAINTSAIKKMTQA